MVNSAVPNLTMRYNELSELEEVAKAIIDFSEGVKIWLFRGDMGVGKTTLIRKICELYEVEDVVHSPTYGLVNEYQNRQKQTFYHFDFYRIKTEEEALDIGTEDYFYSGNPCFIEWPSRVERILPQENILEIKMALDADTRVIELTRHE